ncbi:unnamed protein product [Paramecium sonneborni]|uniref:Signal peptidase complex catalytic subunit SEC11 n=1 Tax=Paramecium sonneborni TaxID=65129 RepID=A0A8S1MK01_9CILI|nr:unnamed protein product [Paramecium sonneborni]
MDVVLGYVDQFLHLKFRKIILQIVSLAIVVGSVLSIWKSLQVVSFSESPVIVVSSGSMEPVYYRGDILFLTYFNKPFEVGDVIVYKIKDQDIPIIHRVFQIVQKSNDPLDQLILTKGDSNQLDDRALYPRKQMWLERSDIMGKIEGVISYVGNIAILLYDYPSFKFIMIGFMSLFVLEAKDPQR